MNSRQRRKLKRKLGIKRRIFIFSSCGNDSVALLKWAIDHYPNDEKIMVYSNTGWSAPFWDRRVKLVREYAEKNGVSFVETESEGMESLVRRKKGWPKPASNMQFCTNELKVQPAIKYMNSVDDFGSPHFRTLCLNGVRREESKNRENVPEFYGCSERHGGRKLRSPLVKMKEDQRNELIFETGLPILPHKSRECFPCINSNRSDFRMLAEYPERISKIEKIENEMGYTSKGKPRVMFRPYRHMGATGIREVVKWGLSERGKYQKEESAPCSSGFCGF
jgi:3'-phosphoadenosine 5'-phosphosulfate sulfotransferase (PAPS reductase)/FAD synthetase